jgi:hypothetical protein
MFYCNAGQLLVVNPKLEPQVGKFCRHFNGKPYALGIMANDKSTTNILHGEIVMALEASVAPFYWSDTIRCLWGEKIVYIRRVDLQHIEKFDEQY